MRTVRMRDGRRSRLASAAVTALVLGAPVALLAGPAAASDGVVLTADAGDASGGAIDEAYRSSGGSYGPLEGPSGSVVCGLAGGGCRQAYWGGAIAWSPATGARVLSGAVLAKWDAGGGPAGPLGYPVADQRNSWDGGASADFQGGSILYTPAAGAHELRGAIRDLWNRWRLGQNDLGQPLTDEIAVSGGVAQVFQNGSVYFTPATGAHTVRGAIRDRWAALGFEQGPLGFPLTDQVYAAGGAASVFQGGSIYFSPATGAHAVQGAIRDRWAALGYERGALGYPVTDEVAVSGGAASVFQGGSIYFSPATGAHAVQGAIRDGWAALGYERGVLGYPVTDEVPVLRGAASVFQGGSIYFSADTGAHAVRGAIRDKWGSLGFERGSLGFPVTGEIPLVDGAGSVFQRGTVYFSPATGAHVVRGAVLDAWAATGAQNGPLGYPLTDESAVGRAGSGGAANHFQGGSVYWSRGTGAHAVQGAIRDAWARTGWEMGPLGFPTSNEYAVPGGRRSDFEHGYVDWSPARGAVVHR
jgi:uncharacterized protein with LGFP repeats